MITSKPVLYSCNISEDDMMSGNLENDYVKKVKEYAAAENSGVVVVCAKLEEELSGLEDEEKAEMLAEYGLEESGLDKLIRASYKLLGLISYLTAGVQEVRAWTIKEGTKAPAAAGKIHSDIERGFIRAETIAFDDLVTVGTMTAAKEKGLVRLEGKDYVVKDGDVILFRFNV
jgi:GTP-binding protein YchF